MKNDTFMAAAPVAVAAAVVSVTVAAIFAAGRAAPEGPKAGRDATLIRPEVSIDTSGGKVRIRGAFRVARPVSSGKDHKVSVRLTISPPDGGKEVYSEELAKIDYRRDHPREKPYEINKEMNFDAAGLDVKVAAVSVADDGVFPVGHEFASVVAHGTPDRPAPGPKAR